LRNECTIQNSKITGKHENATSTIQTGFKMSMVVLSQQISKVTDKEILTSYDVYLFNFEKTQTIHKISSLKTRTSILA
jgi:hypothetical protein